MVATRLIPSQQGLEGEVDPCEVIYGRQTATLAMTVVHEGVVPSD